MRLAKSATTRPAAGGKPDGSARERLLSAASALFYAEGVNNVGIDRVIAEAGVAKASLYSTFGSKDALVAAYLKARGERRRGLIEARVASLEDARAQILSVFDLLNELAAEPGFRGCAFANVNAEGNASPEVDRVCQGARAWVESFFTTLAARAGAPQPEVLGRELALLYHGTNLVAAYAHDPSMALTARGIAERLLEALPSAT